MYVFPVVEVGELEATVLGDIGLFQAGRKRLNHSDRSPDTGTEFGCKKADLAKDGSISPW